MKKYYVLKFYDTLNCAVSVPFCSDSLEDCQIYAALMQRNQCPDDTKYTFRVGNFVE